jgi:SNF2 family DNA or RNA helicase
MIVIPRKKALLLYLKEPDRVLNFVPTAKPIMLTGKRVVAVPHKLDEIKVLRNLGFSAPSPIRYYYDWPGQYQPFMAQRETAEFLTLHRNAFVLNDLGTGKTMSALWAYDYLRSQGEVCRALIVSSLSTLERVWADEIFGNFPHITYSVVHGTPDRRLKLLKQPSDIYIINHDGVKTRGIADALAKRPDIDLVIIDEIAQVARTAGTDRWKALNKICNRQVPRRLWGMTGKPTPNAPTDAWAQCKLVVPNNVPPYFNRFKDQVMRQLGPFTWVARDSAIETVHQVMQPSIRFTRDDCVDLPPCIYQTRTAEFTDEQKKAYKEMASSLRSQLEAGEVLAVNEAVKVGKLLQIACGVAYGPGGEPLVLPAGPRIDAVTEIIEEAEGKVIVFVPFVGAAEHVASQIGNAIGADQVAVIHGGISSHQRGDIFKAFQSSAAPRVLVAQPAAMAHGLTLTAANTIVWYGAIWNNEIYEQANGRIVRPGQKNTQFIIHIEGSAIERKLYDRLRKKQTMQGLLLQMVESNDLDTI